MNKLRWDKPDAPCLLCGVPVTPEAWDGGVVDGWSDRYSTQGWFISDAYRATCGCGDCQGIAAGTPVFPPRGWAGKTDAELWDVMCGDGPCHIEVDKPFYVCVHFVNCKPRGLISATCYENTGCSHNMLGDHTVTQLIPALQNAQVLARRLRDE